MYVLGKRVSSIVGGTLIPFIMARIDENFEAVRIELLKSLYGTVLDVGSGGGPYLKYAFL